MLIDYAHERLGPWSYPDERPRTRGECSTFPRPCPFVSCRYHLAIDAHRAIDGSTRLVVLHEDPTTMANTCALDVADGLCDLPNGDDDPDEARTEEAQVSLYEIAKLFNYTISAERVRQTIMRVQKEIRKRCAQSLEDYEIVPPEDATPASAMSDTERATSLAMCELAKGPRARTALIDKCVSSGISHPTASYAMSRLPGVEAYPIGESVEIAECLRDALIDGPRDVSEVTLHVCAEMGCTLSSVKNAARRLEVKKSRRGNRFTWTLPRTVHALAAPHTGRGSAVMLRLVGVGQKDLRHPGHPGKARRTD